MNCPICKTGNLEPQADISAQYQKEIKIYVALNCDNGECEAQFSDTGTFEGIENWHSDSWPMQEFLGTA